MSASQSALFQEAVGNPNIIAYLSHNNMDNARIPLTGSKETKRASKLAPILYNLRKGTEYCHLIWANLSRHTDTKGHILNSGKYFPTKMHLTALHLLITF